MFDWKQDYVCRSSIDLEIKLVGPVVTAIELKRDRQLFQELPDKGAQNALHLTHAHLQ